MCIRNNCTRFSSTLINPCVVFAIIEGKQKMKTISTTALSPGPTHMMISGVTAMIGTVCSNTV